MGIIDSIDVTNPNSVSRTCHAAVKHAEPDFSDRPVGSLFADGQRDWAEGNCVMPKRLAPVIRWSGAAHL
jgi:hypothetical protein